jgi:RecA-family ATPase
MPLIVDVIPSYLHKSHLTLLTGPPYIGKSRLLSWLSHLLTTGEPGFWPKLPPLKVLFCTERTMALVGTQFQGLGLPSENKNLQFLTIGDKSADWYRNFRYNPLGELSNIVKIFNPDIIILDTLVHFLSGSRAVNDYGSMAEKIMTVQIFASQHKCAVLAVHHTAKEKIDSFYGKTIEKTLGSQAITGNTTAIWNLSHTVEPVEDQPVYLTLHAETHATLSPKDVFIKVDKNLPLQIIEQTEIKQKGDLQGAILSCLFNESFAIKDLIERVSLETGSVPQNIYKAISKLADKGKISLLNGLVSRTL